MDPNQFGHMFAFMGPIFGLFILLAWAIFLIPMWQIFKKAGFAPALSLLMLLPLVNLIMLYVLAFSRWKVVPAPEYAMGYPQQYPSAGYPPAGYPPQTGYGAPGAYGPNSYPPQTAPVYPPNEPPNSI